MGDEEEATPEHFRALLDYMAEPSQSHTAAASHELGRVDGPLPADEEALHALAASVMGDDDASHGAAAPAAAAPAPAPHLHVQSTPLPTDQHRASPPRSPPPSAAAAGSVPQFVSFSSLGRKPIAAPSEAARLRAQALLADAPPTPALRTSTPAASVSPPSAPPASSDSGALPASEAPPSFVSFATARGRPTQAPSAAALARANRLLTDAPSAVPAPAVATPAPLTPAAGASMAAFETARGRPVKPSAAAVARAKQLLPDLASDAALSSSPHSSLSSASSARSSASSALSSASSAPLVGPSDAECLADAASTPEKRSSPAPDSPSPTLRLRTPGSNKKPRFAYASPVTSPPASASGSVRTSAPLGRSSADAASRSPVSPVYGTPFRQPRRLPLALPPPSPSPPPPLPRPAPLFDLALRRSSPRLTLQEFAHRYAPHARPLSLPAHALLAHGVAPAVVALTFDTAASFAFPLAEARACAAFAEADTDVGAAQMEAALRRVGASAKELAHGWTAHHLRLIVWKLASYERAFAPACAGHALTAERAWTQLCYRLERERAGHQSALKRVLARDELAGRHMVLAVAAVLPAPAADADARPELLLTDGWYVARAQLDAQLALLATMGRIVPGAKLRIWGARLSGDEAVAPLEQEPSKAPALVLHVNGTRRAVWHAPLGFQRRPVFCLALRSVRPDGGPAPAVDVCVLRRYAALFYDRGARLYRTAAEEEDAARRQQEAQAREWEAKLAAMAREQRRATGASAEDGERLWLLAKGGHLDASELTAAQLAALRAHDTRAALEPWAEGVPRDTAACVTLRVADLPRFAVALRQVREAELMVWQPSQEWLELPEGVRIRLFSVRPPGAPGAAPAPAPAPGAGTAAPPSAAPPPSSFASSSSLARISVSRPPLPARLRPLACPLYRPRHATPLAAVGLLPPGSELDTVLVLLAHGQQHTLPPRPGAPPGTPPQHLRTAFLVAPDSQLLVALQIRAHASLLASRYPNVEPGRVLACSNVVWRATMFGSLLIVSASERAVLSSQQTQLPPHLRALHASVQAWRADLGVLHASLAPLIEAYEADTLARARANYAGAVANPV